MKSNIVGGPSIIFNRYHEKGQTIIRNKTKQCQGCVGLDANALYLWALMQPMPTGWYTRRTLENDFKPQHRIGGQSAADYLDYLSATTGAKIQHKWNSKEKQIGSRRLPVDGWCAATQTVYQYHGCYWHAHDCQVNAHRTDTKTLEDVRQETEKTSQYIRSLGYNLVEMWECQWQKMGTTDVQIRTFLQERRTRKIDFVRNMTEEKIVQQVKSGELFGVIECDISVPEQLKAHFQEMTPIFKNTEISREDIGEFMTQYAEEHNQLNQPRRSLVGSYYGTKIMLATPLAKWYLEHGLVITKVYEVCQWEPNTCFRNFGDSVSDARREGDQDPDKSIIADTMKLLGNSGYGKTVTNKEKFRDVKYVDSQEAGGLLNDKRFVLSNPIAEDLCEVELRKKAITLDLPLQVGFFVYQYAKLRMLSFYYDFIDHFIDRTDYEYCGMDTDSAYLALSAPTMEELVKPHLQKEYYMERSKWLPAVACDDHKEAYLKTVLTNNTWHPTEECCKQKALYDKRTPGLFKVEWEGDGIVSLCSKTHYCFGATDKMSSKGLSRAQNKLTKDDYLEVLQTKRSGSGQNMGFRVHDNDMYTYIQQRDALSYFYIKRKVQADGVSTLPPDV